jgi:hypothetical protein
MFAKPLKNASFYSCNFISFYGAVWNGMVLQRSLKVKVIDEVVDTYGSWCWKHSSPSIGLVLASSGDLL